MSDPIDYHKLKQHPLAELFLKYNEEDLTLQPYGRHLEIPPPLSVRSLSINTALTKFRTKFWSIRHDLS